MTRTTVGILAGLGLAVLAASRLDAAGATGVIAGYLAGASLGLLGVLWQRHVLRTAPARVLNAGVQAFLLEIAGLLCGVLAARFVEPVAAVADWKGFALAYAGATAVCLVLGSLEQLRMVKARPATQASTIERGPAL